MDSTAIAYWIRPEIGITIDYGQRPAAGEIRAAGAICKSLNIEHIVVGCDLSAMGSGDLAGRPPLSVAPASEWWPYRNQMLITLAAMVCVGREVGRLLIGALKSDGFHADGRRDFIESMNQLLTLQEGGLRLEAPAIHLDARELITESNIPTELLAWSHSCHVSEFACGTCKGCRKHYEVHETLGNEPY